MKLLKLFAIAAMAFGLVACDEERGAEPVIDPDATTTYVGTTSVVFQGATTDTPNVEVAVDPDPTTKKMKIEFKRVQFVPAMPALDIIVPDVPYTEVDGSIKLSGENIIPECMGGPFPMYTVTGLTGTITSTTISLSLNFGSIPTTYKGTKK